MTEAPKVILAIPDASWSDGCGFWDIHDDRFHAPAESLPVTRYVRADIADEMTEWQPIETAPKDGTPVLLYIENEDIGGYQCTARWDVNKVFWEGIESECEIISLDLPTHWRPLREPPKVA